MRFLKLSALMATMLFSGMLMLSVLSMRGLPASPGGGGVQQFPSRNGDVNCDGDVTLADGLHLLNWLFTGGEEPCATAQEMSLQEVVVGLERIENRTWPPKPEDMVSIQGTLVPAGVLTNFPVFTVPVDKWLVVTEGRFDNLAGSKIVEAMGEDVTEIFSGKFLTNLSNDNSRGDFVSTTGLSFSPGSQVGIQTSQSNTIDYSLIGYLVDAE